ncbi:hypothetical protein OC835_002455 [Tilletia horrida]|nr:hypothetical protein OC835_002455 [Tilletia horrida]
MDVDESRDEQLYPTLLATLRAHPDPTAISLASKFLRDANLPDASFRAQVLVIRSLARSRMGLRALAKVDAMCAQVETPANDAEVLMVVASALRFVGLFTQARQSLADARRALQTIATTASTRTNVLLRDIADAEAALAPSAVAKFPEAVLVRIFAALDDVLSRARCARVCRSWRDVLRAHSELWDDVRLWKPFPLPTLSYYIDDAESKFPPPQRSFAQTNGALLYCARASKNRLRHVSVDLRGFHETMTPRRGVGDDDDEDEDDHRGKDEEDQVLVRTWAILRRSAPTLRTLSLCFDHRDTGARTHLSPLLRACIRLNQLTLYYVPRARTEVEQSYDPLLVDLRLDDSNLPTSSLRAAHLYLPECAIVFDRLLIQRFAHLEELTLVRGVFEPLELSWFCALLKRVAPTLRTLRLGCAIDRSGSPTFNRLAMFRIELARLEEYRSDTTEFDPEVRRLQATVRVPALKVLDLCNLDPEAILLVGESGGGEELPAVQADQLVDGENAQGLEQQRSETPMEADSEPALPFTPPTNVSAHTYPWPAYLPESPSGAVTPASPSAQPLSPRPTRSEHVVASPDYHHGAQRTRKRRVPSSTPSPPRLPLGILSVGDQLENLEVLTLRTVSIQEDAAVLSFLQGLTARSLLAWSRSRAHRPEMQNSGSNGSARTNEQDEQMPAAQTQPQSQPEAQHAGSSETVGEDGHGVRMLLPRLRSLTIQDHASLSAEIVSALVEARYKYVEDEEALMEALVERAVSLRGTGAAEAGTSEDPAEEAEAAHESALPATMAGRRTDGTLASPTVSGLVRVASGELLDERALKAARSRSSSAAEQRSKLPQSGVGDGQMAGEGGEEDALDAQSAGTVRDGPAHAQQGDQAGGPSKAPLASRPARASSPPDANAPIPPPPPPKAPSLDAAAAIAAGLETESHLPTDSPPPRAGSSSSRPTAGRAPSGAGSRQSERGGRLERLVLRDPSFLARLNAAWNCICICDASPMTGADGLSPPPPCPLHRTHGASWERAGGGGGAGVHFRPLETLRLVNCQRIAEYELEGVRAKLGSLSVT